MNAITKMSEKGQVVVPAATRRRLGWDAGLDLEVIETEDSVTLRARPKPAKTLTVDQAVAAFKRLYQHEGPPVPIEHLGWAPDMEDDAA